MKILIADTQYPKGHSNLNRHLLSLVSELPFVSQIKVLNFGNYYDKTEFNAKVNFVQFDSLFFSERTYWGYMLSFLNAILIGLRMLFVDYDKVVFFTFDTISFSLVRLFVRKPIFLFHHNNTDHLSNKYKLFLFNLYSKKVNHIVFADFIKERLFDLGVKDNQLFVMEHPLPQGKAMAVSNIFSAESDHISFLALGHGNDEKLVASIIEKELNEHLLEQNNVRLIIRSKITYQILPASIVIINTFLSREEYESLYQVAKGVLILFPDTFVYRYSGTLLDGFFNRKIIIGRDIPIVKYYACDYSYSCTTFKDINDLFFKICNTGFFAENEYSIFVNRHSDESIRNRLYEILL